MSNSASAAASSIGSTSKPEGETPTVKTEVTASDGGGAGVETVGSSSASTCSTSAPTNLTQTSAKESRSSAGEGGTALHWLADLATQKAKDDTKGILDIPSQFNSVPVFPQ